MTKYIGVALLAIIAILLGVITYNTGLGKIFPQKQAQDASCDSLLTQQLFYSQLLGTGQRTKVVSRSILNAPSIVAIKKIVSANSNIDAKKSTFFYSLSTPGKCQARLVLQHPDSHGNNVLYVPYKITAYAAAHGNGNGNNIMEQIHVDVLGIEKQKE